MNYPDSVRFLYELGNELKSAKYDLGRMARVLEALGHPERRPGCFVHVAGTNGKGSTCAMLEAALRADGRRTGLYTSPHLRQPTERIRIDGEPVSDSLFVQAFETVRGVAEELLARGAIDLHPSYFEMVTAMGFLLFREQRVDIAVIEVGLGGRLDATNPVEPELCVITPIDFDHESFLGKDLPSIASEKAGILKPGVPAVVAHQRDEVAPVLREQAARVGCELRHTDEWCVTQLALDAGGSRFRLTGRQTIDVVCPLAGSHQVENAVTAVAALDCLGLREEAISDGIAAVRWPGRLEHIGNFVLDGAHNPAGARALASYVREFYGGRRKRLIFGAMRDKAIDEMAGALFPLFDEVIVTAPRQPRALDPASYREVVEHPKLVEAVDLPAALERVQGSPDPVFISGSLFLVAEARDLLEHKA
ncbi:MAG TPA: bifunctional folylpolyglutamate synthase/dihydrofolate synthase [Solibacterales bacterium]|nr:bifunctional folylpolyglutamate synthase/dihydrofolate synthase [Bryobacterales bacterium]